MVRLQALALIITGLLMAAILAACGGRSTPTSDSSVTRPPEVVTFATQPPKTRTPLLPNPIPVTPTLIPAPLPISVRPVLTTTDTVTSTTRAVNENPLTGLIVDPQVFTRRPMHVRPGNDPDARPQLNLSKADVVYEELVEWWITRFTAVYYSTAPEIVAPVRSARLINLQLTGQYTAALVNSGGSDPVRWQLSQLPIVNLDEYFHPDPYFYREGESWQKRLAVNLVKAHAYMQKKGLEHVVSLRGFTFSSTVPTGNPALGIYIDYPAKGSKLFWQFNAAAGQYERQQGGEPMLDGVTGTVITASNVIIYFAKHYETDIVEDSTGATSVGITVNGEGEAWICRDGVVIKGRWRTDGNQTPEFITTADKPIALKPGKTWIEVVPTDYKIELNKQ